MSAALRPHVSVLLDETVDALAIQPGSRIVDGLVEKHGDVWPGIAHSVTFFSSR